MLSFRVEEREDKYAIALRAINLAKLPWLSCQPPDIESGATNHWLLAELV